MSARTVLIVSTNGINMLVVVMKVCWISAGVSSFIAGYVIKETVDEFIYTHIDDQHEDSLRFIKDCERALDRPITILQSPYKSVSNVIQTFRFINGPYGAKCTDVLKKRVRKEWEYGKEDLTYIWGFDSSKRERQRANRTIESMSEFKHEFPLIDRNLTKEDCHGILRTLGIKRPTMYELGYRNNNCIGCVKGGMGYWNKIRKDFPGIFEARAEQERLVGHSCLNGIYLDELNPTAGKIEDEVMDDCGIMCQINLK